MKTRNLMVMVAIFPLAEVASQGQTQQWDRRFGGSADDNLYSVQ